uniref:transient receptor potential cation channel subfamily A member 1 homolog n=1 Tax=Styela clava TaxID=7725 RepID=UPI00193A318F|nr:transient receptor potential cation channel subfamily A member 1 homolog [Styela clava]
MQNLSQSSSDSGISVQAAGRPSVAFLDDHTDEGEAISVAMREGEFKKTARRKSQWGQYLLNVDMKRVMSSGTFKLTLLQLARDGESDTLEFLLNTLGRSQCSRMLNSTTDEEGVTALHLAAKNNHYDVCKKLISSGANVNIRAGESRATPLHYAARIRPKKRLLPSIDEEVAGTQIYATIPRQMSFDRETSVIMLLHSSGANINDVDIEGQTPLHSATIKGNLPCVQQLLECQGVDVETKDGQGMTALHMAATHGYVDIVKALLGKGANLHSTDNDLMSPLHFASADGNVESVRVILNKARESNPRQIKDMVYRVDAGRNTALHIAVGKGHLQVVMELLGLLASPEDRKKMVSLTRSHGDTPLHIASAQGHFEICERLVECGADVDSRNDSLATPLLLAAHHNNYEIADFLTSRGSDLETRDKDNLTPLLLACKQGHLETLSWLIEHGADCTATDKHDKTCLMLAVEDQRTAAVHELLKYDSILRLMDETDKNSNGVLHIAARKGYLPIIKVLLDHGARIDSKNEDEATALHISAQFGQHITLRELLDHDKNTINAVDENANTALHLSAIEGHTKCVQTLIEHGVNVALRNQRQMTPLDCASSKGWESTVLALLQAQSAVNPIKGSRTTPLHEACFHGHVQVVKVLLDWRADVGAKIADGRNPLDCAIDQDQDDCVQAILEHTSWRQAMRNSYVDPITGHIVTPARKLIVKMPEMAQFAFTQCISDNRKKWDSHDLEVTLDFEFLDDMYTVTEWLHRGRDVTTDNTSSGDREKQILANGDIPPVEYKGKHKSKEARFNAKHSHLAIPEDPNNYEAFNDQGKLNGNAMTYTEDANILRHNHPLMIMVSTKREGLLQHPVVTALLQYKWNKYGGFVYYSSLIFLMVFVVLLNCYMLLIPPPYTVDFLKSLANRRFFLEFESEHLTNYTDPDTCYSQLDSGTTYRGFVNMSRSNKSCIPWSTTSTDKNLYPNSGLIENYCRNPGSLLESPWCFTEYDDEHPEDTVREECDIELCTIYIDNDDLPKGTTCHFPFILGGAEQYKCINHADGSWCSATANYDEDGKWGFCTEVDPYCVIPSELKKPCGDPTTNQLNCEARGCCYKIYDKGLLTEYSECFQKFDKCSDWSSYCPSDANVVGCEVDWMMATCPLTCGICNVSEKVEDSSQKKFLYLMSTYPENTYEHNWREGCYYCLEGAEKKWGTDCRHKGAWEDPVKIVLMIFCVFNLLRLILQIWNYKLEAFRPIFFLELLLYILCLVLVIDFSGFDLEYTRQMNTEKEIYDELVNKFQKETGLRKNWQWQCGVMALFLSWMNLLLYIQKIPYLGIYVVMFNDIFKTFTKFFIVFLLFIFSFAFTFHALLQNEIEFQFPFQSILKATVMMVGELDFTGIFLGGSEDYEEKVNYLILTYILFSIFIVVMMIIIMNLLVGLAVGDIMEVKEHATLERLKMQVELALEVEFAVPDIIRKRFVRKSANIKPNRYRASNALTRAIFQDKNLSTKNLANVMMTGKSENEEMQESMQQLISLVRDLKVKTTDHDAILKDLLAETKEMKSTVDENVDVQQQKMMLDDEAKIATPSLSRKKSSSSLDSVKLPVSIPAFMRSSSFRRDNRSSGRRLRSSLKQPSFRSNVSINKRQNKSESQEAEPLIRSLSPQYDEMDDDSHRNLLRNDTVDEPTYNHPESPVPPAITLTEFYDNQEFDA